MKKSPPILKDINYLVSISLLIATVAAALTGLVADLWDLNDFVYHTWAGYALAVLAALHVGMQWGRLTAYLRVRLRHLRRLFRRHNGGRAHDAPGRTVQQESHSTTASDQSGTATRVPLLSRRDMAGLLLGGIGGFGLGRIGQSQQLPAGRDIGLVYHEWSKPGISTLLGTLSDWGSQPPLYKTYPDAEQIALPTPGEFSGLPTGQAIRRRRSKRDYTDKPLTLTTLSDLLYLADGINAEQWGTSLRSAPSAGALYPIEIYVIAHRVEDIEPGLYHYHVHDHALHVLKRGSLQAQVVRHGLQQQFLGEAGVVLVLTAIFQRLRFKYQERSYRYALMEVGHIGQNVYLAATSLGMGTCMVGAFSDDEVNAMLGVDGENEAALAMMPVGNI